MADIRLSTNPYKGTRDFYPQEMKLRNWFFGKIRKVLESFGFDEYNGPMLESLELYEAKSGEEIASKQTYNFVDRGDRRLAIRPEMTPTVARMVAGKLGELNFPLKWYSIPNMYRYERAQKGRLREFWQLNADIFGVDGYESDLEIITAAVRIMKGFGADASMFRVHINNRRFFNDVIAAITGKTGDDAKAVSKIVDHKNKVDREAYESEMSALGISPAQIAEIDELYGMTVEQATALCPDSVGSAELTNLFRALRHLGIDDCCVFDFGIVRGLDYYTGTVFEVFDEDPDNNRAMFGGGRYDNLVGLFVKDAKVSGVGFGMGDVTLEIFLRTHGLIPEGIYRRETSVLVTRFDGDSFEDAAAVAETVRATGVTASAYLGGKKFGKQIDYADKEGYSHVAICGGDEKAAGKVKFKCLATREETLVDYTPGAIKAYFGV